MEFLALVGFFALLALLGLAIYGIVAMVEKIKTLDREISYHTHKLDRLDTRTSDAMQWAEEARVYAHAAHKAVAPAENE